MAGHVDMGEDFSTYRHRRDPAPGALGLVEELLNTRNSLRGTELLSDGAGVAKWFLARGLIAPGTHLAAADAVQARGVREALRRLLAADPAIAPASYLAPLQAASDAAGLRLCFGETRAAELQPTAAGLAGALGTLLATVHAAMLAGTWSRLKVCQTPGCRWAFYDATRNASTVWCSDSPCANRAKTRAYRERQRAHR